MVDLSADFIANDDKWTGERVAADWPAFGRETIALFDILAARVEREERELYPLAETLYASGAGIGVPVRDGSTISSRSEEHTSELQSLMSISYAVFCLKTNKK